jgi:hypothetical protein
LITKWIKSSLDSRGKASFGFWAKRFGVSRTTTDDGIRHAAASTDEPTIAEAIRDIALDALWHVIQAKKEKFGSFRTWIVAQGESWPGSSVVVMRQHANGALTPPWPIKRPMGRHGSRDREALQESA